MIQQRARHFTVFGFLVGFAGFAGVGLALASHPTPAREDLWEAGAITALAALSWRYSFSVLSRSRFSLDLAYMVSALLCHPSPLPAVVGAGTGLLGSFLRQRTERDGARMTLTGRLSFLMVNTGTLIAMMLAGELVVRHVLGGREVLRDFALGIYLYLFLDVACVFVVLTAVNLILMGLSAAIRGDSLRQFVHHHFRHVLPLEAYNIPLSVLMVITRFRAGFGGFLLLGSLALMTSVLLKNLNRAHEHLGRAGVELSLRAEELSALDSIGREIASSLDLARVFRIIHHRVNRLLDVSTFSVALFDRDSGTLTHAYLVRDRIPRSPSSFPLGRGAISWAIRSGRALRIDGATAPASPEEEALYDPSELDAGARSLLVIPLHQHDGSVMGALAVASRLPSAYTPRNERMLSSIAQHASIAIENARYYERATVDPGTGLFFRDYFMQRVEEELSRARRYGRPFSVMMLDLDGFKRINDLHGHQAGDALLRRVGEAIRQSLRSIDTASRYGGEEFAVLLPETDGSEARPIAERIRAQVAAIRVDAGGVSFGTTISIGLASWRQASAAGAADLIGQADRALYQAKHEGKDKVIAAAER